MIRLVYCCFMFSAVSAVCAQSDSTYINQDKALLDQMEFRSLFEDTGGNLWLGTRGQGLFKLAGDKLYKLNLEAKGFEFSGAASISGAADGRLFFTGRGVLLKHNDEWLILDQSKMRNTVVFNAFVLGDALFFAGNRGVTIMLGNGDFSYLEGNSEPPHPVVHDVLLDKNGSLWLATRKAGLQVWHEGDTEWTGHYVEANCRKLLASANGDVWVGSTGGVIHYKQQTQHFSLLKAGDLLLPEFEDPDGTIWFSSESLGVWTYHKGDWSQKSTSVVFDVIRRKDNTVWAATSGGHIEINPGR